MGEAELPPVSELTDYTSETPKKADVVQLTGVEASVDELEVDLEDNQRREKHKKKKANSKKAEFVVREYYDKGDEDLEQLVPRETTEIEKPPKILTPNRKLDYPPGLSVTIKREIAFFQRKMRAYRKLKNHIFTSSLEALEREAQTKNWGELPLVVLEGACKTFNVSIEVCFHFWPRPFVLLEKQWWTRHFEEFAKEWKVPQSQAMDSPLLTPYMKYVRAHPPAELLAVKPDLVAVSSPPKFPFPMTNCNFIMDAKTMLTYYGVHKLQDYEVKEGVDYEFVDFWAMLEDVSQAGRAMCEKMLRYRKALKMCDESE